MVALKNGEGNYVSWKCIAGILVSIILAVVGVLYADTKADINKANDRIEKKVDIEQYRVDVKRFDDKLDKLINMHIKE
jgi:hypothetical protein